MARVRTPEGESGDHFSAPTFARKCRAPWRPDGGSFIIHGQQEGSQYMKSLLRFALRDWPFLLAAACAVGLCAERVRMTPGQRSHQGGARAGLPGHIENADPIPTTKARRTPSAAFPA